jgi:hypothetical protein
MSTRTTAIFAGPSATEFPAHHHWKIFPPARSGDFDRAVSMGFSQIVFADALFFDANPTHPELIRALAAGVKVFGTSSAGALRAIELRDFGMIGLGLVHELYRRGLVRDDGELAVSMRADDYSAAAPPLIQLRYYLGYIRACGIPSDVARRIFSAFKFRYFMIRDMSYIESVLETYLGPERAKLQRAVDDPIFRIKSIDFACAMKTLTIGELKGERSTAVGPHINTKWLGTGLRL